MALSMPTRVPRKALAGKTTLCCAMKAHRRMIYHGRRSLVRAMIGLTEKFKLQILAVCQEERRFMNKRLADFRVIVAKVKTRRMIQLTWKPTE